MSTIDVDIAESRKDIEFIKKELGGTVKDFKEHITSAQSFRDKVTAFEPHKREFDAHVLADRWLFGVVITMNLAILVKIFT